MAKELKRYGRTTSTHTEWPDATVSGKKVSLRKAVGRQHIGNGYFVFPDNPLAPNHDDLIAEIKREISDEDKKVVRNAKPTPSTSAEKTSE